MELFRELNAQDEQEFRQWARENYTAYHEIKGIWHPIVQAECVLMNKEASYAVEKPK